MAFKEINDLSPNRTISLGGVNRKTGNKNPTEVEGYYLGSRTVPDDKKKSGLSYIHVFETFAGPVGVWGKTDLDRKILTIPLGTMTRVVQSGMAQTKNGAMYKFTVGVDEENVKKVATASTSTQGGYNDEADDEADDDATTAYASGGEDDNDEDLAQQQALLAAEKRAKVQALLNKNKKA